MKCILLVVVSLALATAGPVFDKCPDTLQNLPDNKVINGNQIMGLWYFIRKGPVPAAFEAKVGKVDCMNSVIYRETDGPAGVVNYLFHVRKAGNKHIVKSSTFNVVEVGDAGMVENNFVATKSVSYDGGEAKQVTIQEKLIETNEGRSWSLWAACISKEGGNSTVVWSIKSRYPYLDAAMDQMLVEKIEKYGGVGPTQLRGIGQTHCHQEN